MDPTPTPYAIPVDRFLFAPQELRDSFLIPVGALIALRIAVVPRSESATDTVPSKARLIPLNAVVQKLLAEFRTAIELPLGPKEFTSDTRHLEIWPCQEIMLVDTGAVELVFDIGLLSLSPIARAAIATILIHTHAQACAGLEGAALDDFLLHVDVRTNDEAFVLLKVPLSEPIHPLPSLLTIATTAMPAASYMDDTGDPRKRAAEVTVIGADASEHVASAILRDTAKLLGARPHKVVPIFYATNRLSEVDAETGVGYTSDRGNDVAFGVARVAIPISHRRGKLEQPRFPRIFHWLRNPEEHITMLNATPVAEADFYQYLNTGIAGATRDDILLFVHGYNTRFREAIQRAAQFANDISFPGATAVFSWPSVGTLPSYTVDENNAEWSILSVEAFLAALRQRSNAGAVHIFAHSMGNRPVIHALSRLASGTAVTFSEIVLAAPDMDADTLFKHAKLIRKIVTRLTLYASASDRPLYFSKKIHGYARAGTPSEAIDDVLDGFDAIDASNRAKFLSDNHTYVAEDPWVLHELHELLAYHLPAHKRHALRPREKGLGWVFRDDLVGE
jgi:esterase/lipase superfamily enzyme